MRLKSSLGVVALILASLVSGLARGEDRNDLALVFGWVRNDAVPIRTVDWGGDDSDLRVVDDFARSARLLGFGESNHGLHDHPQFRNRLFKYLVEKHGFRAISLESGILESRIV